MQNLLFWLKFEDEYISSSKVTRSRVTCFFVIVAFIPQTQVQSSANLFLQDHQNTESEYSKPADKSQKQYPTKPSDLGPRFEGDGCEATELAEGQAKKVPAVLPMEDIELLDKIMILLTEAMHGQEQPSWMLDERLQKGVCVVVGKPLDRYENLNRRKIISIKFQSVHKLACFVSYNCLIQSAFALFLFGNILNRLMMI